jgi:hypothetical protein
MARKGKLQDPRLVALNDSTATLLSDADENWVTRTFKNVDSSITIYIGNSNVSGASDGFELLAGESLAEDSISTAVYAIAASGTPNVNVLEVGGQ